VLIYPLVFGARNVGFFILSFRREARKSSTASCWSPLAQQATLAVPAHPSRLLGEGSCGSRRAHPHRPGNPRWPGAGVHGNSHAARRPRRNSKPCKRKNSELAGVLNRIRDLARDGLSEARRSVMALRLDQDTARGPGNRAATALRRSTIPGRVTCTFEGGEFNTGLSRSTSTSCCESPRRR